VSSKVRKVRQSSKVSSKVSSKDSKTRYDTP